MLESRYENKGLVKCSCPKLCNRASLAWICKASHATSVLSSYVNNTHISNEISSYSYPKLSNQTSLALIYQASHVISMLMLYVMLNANPNLKMNQIGIRCSRAK